MVLLAHIREQHHLSLGSYGRPRMTQELKEIGLSVGHRRVGRLMLDNRIYLIRTHKYKATTDSHHRFNTAPNVLDGNFSAQRPNQKWAGDISYIWTAEGWLYLAVMMDLDSRGIVGWALSNRLKRDLALQALDRAIALRNPPQGCIHHTDRGSQYCSYEYQNRLQQLGLQVSMSGKGNCYDNAAVLRRENNPLNCFLILLTFFKTLKAELIWRHNWATRDHVTQALFQHINGFYNNSRRHLATGGVSSATFEGKTA